ncbi:type I methionyl aminopeptidase [Mumia sp. zg.B53]|uniref:type I methionyl aminopeptidase n=1 Tax=unclassified Mumia TaxID=2621872 RepID=UPI001C6F469C|nr:MULTISPECIES: type I methionyl aminopeptidase [unclassified Mumia]MBW9204694.1 type I methionyl aminopeptidase [Mumia sp. zg.B17]MBW9213910.1 type I methionyl aminopeptidase [Mumia sp. zg.B53]MDD9347541.1 type I methionyl aminopeptidase [Mumia sp.]
MGLFGSGLEIKTPDQVAVMRRAGVIVGETLALLRESVRPGMTTADLDAIAEEHIHSRGAKPNFKGYHGFPATICTSVNDEVVHGIPGGRVIEEGDLVSIDCGCVLDGWHSDAAVTVAVGEVSASRRELMRVCEESLWRGIAAARLGGRVSDIGHAVETYVRSQPAGASYGIVEDYVGHGIGTAMHMPPNVPNFGRPGHGAKLVKGLVLAVEPMLTEGTIDTTTLEDDWTVVTDDSGWSAHFEHTFTLTDTGAWVLSALDGGKARLAELGVPYGGPESD